MLKSEDADKAIASLEAEMASLMSTILIPIDRNHPEYSIALEKATPGRILLDIRRTGTFKSRGV